MHTKTMMKTTPAILAELSFVKGMYLLLIVIYLFPIEVSLAQKATVSEELTSIKTYDFDDPNPIATLASGKHHIYPYFQFDGYHLQPEQKGWKVVTLENDYIEVQILPEVGGKVWGAIEKSTGEEFLYKNEVLKFRNIALRGPWTSGGIEFNFGITGHAPTTSTPVDYHLQEHEDGSVSCTIGARDLASNTYWRVVITLPPDKAFFQTDSYWVNTSRLHQSNYVWQNAAAVARDDLQFYFPGRFYAGHPGDIHPWPIGEDGRDLSLYRNNNFGGSKSYHVIGDAGVEAEYFGAYWHKKDMGTGNWSHYGDAPGKKLWIWAQSRAGGIWEDLLTDEDGQYVEIQSGRFFTQAAATSPETPFDYNALRPGATEHWSEIWFPLVDTDGMKAASKYGVINTTEINRGTIVTLMALQPLNDSLIIKNGHNLLSSKSVTLQPLQIYRDTVASSASDGNLNILLGNHKMVYREEQPDFTRPLYSQNKHADSSVSALFDKGKNQHFHRRFDDAITSFKSVLKLDSAHMGAYNHLAELYYRKALYDSSLVYARKSLAYNTYEPTANYFAGLSHLHHQQWSDAIAALSWAARAPRYASSANVTLAEIYAKRNDLVTAGQFSRRALQHNTMNIKALMQLAVLYRKQRLAIQADSVLAQILKIDPLNHFAGYEKSLLNPGNPAMLSEFIQNIRNEFPAETYLSLASFYMQNGWEDDAVKLLKQFEPHPVIQYWLAYLLKDRSQTESKKHLSTAGQLSPYLVFPYRAESIDVLKWAGRQSDNWKTDYYLGLIYWHKGRHSEAATLFNALGNRPDYSSFYIARAHLNEKQGKDTEDIKVDLQRAKQLAPDEWRSWHALNEYYFPGSQMNQMLEHAQKAVNRFPQKDAIKMDYAEALLYNKNYEECIAYLEKIHILPFEGAQKGRILYEKANLFAALRAFKNSKNDKALNFIQRSRKWPENLGVGKPYNPDYRIQNYLEALIHQKNGDQKIASELFKRIINYSGKFPNRQGTGYAIAALTERRMENTTKAKKMINRWYQDDPQDPLRILVHASFNDDMQTAKKVIENRTQDLNLVLLWQIITEIN